MKVGLGQWAESCWGSGDRVPTSGEQGTPMNTHSSSAGRLDRCLFKAPKQSTGTVLCLSHLGPLSPSLTPCEVWAWRGNPCSGAFAAWEATGHVH